MRSSFVKILQEQSAYDYAAMIVGYEIFELKYKQAEPVSCKLHTGSSTTVKNYSKILAAL